MTDSHVAAHYARRARRTALLAAAIISAALSPAAAATRNPAMPHAIAGNENAMYAESTAKEVKRVGYQKAIYTSCSGVASYCEATIDTVANKRRLEVSSVSCYADTGYEVYIFALFNSNAYDYFTPEHTSGNFYTFNSGTKFLVRAGDTLGVVMTASGDILSIRCKVAGEMVFLK